jgi:uncharacterized phage protein (TIGR02216 family)
VTAREGAIAPDKMIDWHDAMAMCLGSLRMRAADFWSMTPRELEATLRGIFGASVRQALGRAELDDLMRRFPD